jgi:hypothetical protein
VTHYHKHTHTHTDTHTHTHPLFSDNVHRKRVKSCSVRKFGLVHRKRVKSSSVRKYRLVRRESSGRGRIQNVGTRIDEGNDNSIGQ